MGLISTAVTFTFVWIFGTINLWLAIVMGTVGFVLSLVITRFFDVQIVSVTKAIVRRLGSHPAIRDFINNHF